MPDVRDAVAVRVGVADLRIPGEIDAQRVGRGKARTLANEQDGELGPQQLTDLVGDSDTRVADEGDRG